jgi:hypothetical protein
MTSIDWTSAADVVQVIYWTCHVFILAVGYQMGNRVI